MPRHGQNFKVTFWPFEGHSELPQLCWCGSRPFSIPDEGTNTGQGGCSVGACSLSNAATGAAGAPNAAPAGAPALTEMAGVADAVRENKCEWR